MSGFDRWFNMQTWLADDGNDYDLLERSAYFAETHYPSCRRYTEGMKPPGQLQPWKLPPWKFPQWPLSMSRHLQSFYGFSVIEIPMDIQPTSLEVFFCQFRDGLGWLHKCNYEGSKYMQCEMAIGCNGCPRGLK